MNLRQCLSSAIVAFVAATSVAACAGTTPAAEPSHATAAQVAGAQESGANRVEVGPDTTQLAVPRMKFREAQQVEVPKIRLREAQQLAVPRVRMREAQQVEVPKIRLREAQQLAVPRMKFREAEQVEVPRTRF